VLIRWEGARAPTIWTVPPPECDEPAVRAGPEPSAQARLLPSGDSYLLFHEADQRDLLVLSPRQRDTLWTPRVWPGGLLVDGEIEGTWRRAGAVLTIQPWRKLSAAERDAVTAEAESLPLPDLTGKRPVVRWDDILT
jgi:hypothetical protein